MAWDPDKFPTSPEAQKMLTYVTAGWYRRSYYGKWIYQVIGMELDGLREIVEALGYQAFIPHATYTLSFWEVLYDLPIREDLSYEERRERILNKIRTKKTINPADVKRYAEQATGRECTVVEDNPHYAFVIWIMQGEKTFSFENLHKTIYDNKPSHLSYSLGMKLKYQQNLETAALVMEVREITTTESAEADPMQRLTVLTDENGNVLQDEDGYILCDGGISE